MSTQQRKPRRHGGPGHGGPMGMMPGEKARDFKGSMKKLMGYMGKHLVKVVFVGLLAIASTVFSILGPKILGNATDELYKGIIAGINGTGGVDFDAIARILLFLVGLYLLSSLLSYFQGFVMTGVTMSVSYRLRQDIDRKIHKLPLSYYDGTTHGDVLSRITNDVDTISQSLNQSVTQIITAVTSVVGVLIMMFIISWKLTLVALTSIPLSLVFVMLIVRKSQKHFARQQQYLGSVNGHIEEMYGSHAVVKAFNGEDTSVAQFNKINEPLYEAGWKSHFLSGLIMPITGFVGNLSYVAVCILGGWLVVQNALTLGNIQSFIQYIRNFTQPLTQIANISNVLQQTAAAAERVFGFLAETEELPEKEGALSVRRGTETEGGVTIEGNVRFQNVRFGYTSDRIIINDFTADVKKGQKIAIVGPTGAGKTTIVKLLMRFYELNDGVIMIDGHPINDFKRSELRSLFGMVLQDTWLTSGTIADNIRYGRPDAPDSEVVAAAKAAQVDHFIRTQPGGYQMEMSEEADNISQGQKQLLTIARAILANPEMLILDEATSSVDTRTEILIQKAMDHLMEGRTSFIIAHRLSTIRGADLILVMRDGDIAEQGSHEELMAKGGFYYELYNSQFESMG